MRRVLQGLVPSFTLRSILHRIPPRVIPWQYVDLIETDAARRVKLKIAYEGLSRMHPADIADIVEDDAGITPAALIERLRDSVHAPSVARAHGQLLDADLEADELEAEFRAALGRLRERQVAGQIDALNRTASGRELSLDEREEYKRLIREQAALKLLPQQSSNAL